MAVANAPDIRVALMTSAEVKDTIKYPQKGVVTEQLLAELFGVEKFLVPRGVVNTAAKGAAGTYSRIVSKKVLLCYAPEKPGILAPSASYIFAWKGYFGASRFGSRVKKFRTANLESDRIEEEMAFDAKQIAPDLCIYCSHCNRKRPSSILEGEMGWTYAERSARSIRDAPHLMIGDTNASDPLLSEERITTWGFSYRTWS